MNENLEYLLSIYCNIQIANLKKDKNFIKLHNLVKELNYNLVCCYGKDNENKKSKDIYLSVEVYDNKNEMIEIYDEGFLNPSILLVSVDRKYRVKFFTWKDEEFIEDLNWVIKQLEIIKLNKTHCIHN